VLQIEKKFTKEVVYLQMMPSPAHRFASYSFLWSSTLQTTILAWYVLHARTFIWREQDAQIPSPYLVLVSETMLQQTQTSRVQEKLPHFLKQFTGIEILAAAANADVIKAWEGMGYNSRALRLRDCAKAVMERHSGIIPSNLQDLLALPGIGPYTASAIAAFAFHSDIAVVDVNIRRVYSRLLQAMPTTTDSLPEAAITTFAREIFPHGKSSVWHQAVMDIGATYCTARAPKCDSCPIQHLCASAGKMSEGVRTKKSEPSHEGIPNRIWRGRVVQILRGIQDEEWLENSHLHNHLFSASLFTTQERELWLYELLRGLERDKIIEIQHTSQRLSTVQSEHQKQSNTLRIEPTNTHSSHTHSSDVRIRLAS
jgi:A/G-specific adenine glycosylase